MDKYGKVWRLQEYCNRCGGSWSCTGVQCLMEQYPNVVEEKQAVPQVSEAQCFGRAKKTQDAPRPLHPYFAWRYSRGRRPQGAVGSVE